MADANLERLGKPLSTKKRRGRQPKLEWFRRYDPEGYAAALKFIELGAYDYVVFEAMGVTAATFYRWLERGEEDNCPSVYREFLEDVMRARARARVLVEIDVRRDKPDFWLRCGPGRSRPGREGWTETREMDIRVNGQSAATVVVEDQVSQEELAETLRVVQTLGFVSSDPDGNSEELGDETGVDSTPNLTDNGKNGDPSDNNGKRKGRKRDA